MDYLYRQKKKLKVWKKIQILAAVLSFSAFGITCYAAEPEPQAKEAGQAEAGEKDVETLESEANAQSSSEALEKPDLVGDGLIEEDMTETEVTDEKLKQLLSDVQSALPEENGSWSVYLCDLDKDAGGGINEQRMQAASLIKLYIMGAVYENYDELIGTYGQDTIDSYLYSMITVSDNDAANALTSCLGGDDSSAGMMVVNDFCMAHGYTRTSMGRLLLQSNEFGDNYTSAGDCGHFLKSVYGKDTVEYEHAEDMYALLKAQTRRNKIPAQMPEGVSVANKTGELSDVENDAGIIYNAANDLIVVFMSEHLLDVGAAQSTIASISRQIYDYYNG
ncbi:MAG: class A beta-lactamase-related serine hydrolase [Lachnospiraceae bacterium]|nr:class A beta-lactamase-related serine hydrolase [Lachnospiraceae bacterium]